MIAHERRLVAALAGTAAAVLLLTGCGSTQAGGNDPSGKTVKIGLSSVLSGAAASSGIGMDCGIEAFLNTKNSAGGINGYKFTYNEKDTQYDPAVAATLARTFASDGTFAVATVGTAPMQAAVPTLKAKNIPLFAEADGGTLAPPAYDGQFGINPSYAREALSGARFILDTVKKTKAGIAYLDSDAGTPAAAAFPKYFNSHGGKVVSSQAIGTTVTDFSSYAQKLKSAGAQVVYAFILDTQLAALQKAASAIGYDPTWVAWSPAYTPSYIKLAGALSKGVYVSQWTTPNSQTQDPAVKDYLAAVDKKCPKLAADNSVKSGYTIGAAIAYGVQQATKGGAALTSDAFIKALQINGKPLGLTPKMTYNDTTHAGTTGNSYWQITAANGDIKKITPYAELPTAD